MAADHTFYRDLAYIFGAALIGGAAARALRQTMILGYVLAGILIGPFTPGLTLSDVHQFESLAEVGVILLMYTIGLELFWGQSSRSQAPWSFRDCSSSAACFVLKQGIMMGITGRRSGRRRYDHLAAVVGQRHRRSSCCRCSRPRKGRVDLAASVITILLNGLLVRCLQRRPFLPEPAHNSGSFRASSILGSFARASALH